MHASASSDNRQDVTAHVSHPNHAHVGLTCGGRGNRLKGPGSSVVGVNEAPQTEMAVRQTGSAHRMESMGMTYSLCQMTSMTRSGLIANVGGGNGGTGTAGASGLGGGNGGGLGGL
jgi:hypothetical protein